jgi:cell division protein FtsB
VRDSDITNFVTTNALNDYVLKTTYNAKIEALEATIQTLQNEIETLKNNSSGGDSSTEES